MSDFSLEMAAKRIIDARTRRYFREVLGCYDGGFYRSAVVTLWSVVISDMLFKLDQLANAYGDSTAGKILSDIEDTRKRNPRSPEWETLLLKKVADDTHMFEEAEISHLQSLQSHRHLSAHPVLTSTDVLFTPNQETARAHIRNALECVLTRPAIATRKVFDALVEDLEANAKVLPNNRSLKAYLEAKYFPHLPSPVEDKIFRSLWRLVFRETDARCEKNRIVNFRALCVLYERRAPEIRQLIESDRLYFSDCHFDGNTAKVLAAFLRDHQEVYGLLLDSAQTLSANFAKSNFAVFATAWYLGDSIDSHVEEVLRQVREDKAQLSQKPFERFCEVLRREGKLQAVIDMAIELYATSTSFRVGDKRFDKMIRPLLDDFSKDDVIQFLKRSEENDQTYRRGTRDYAEVQRRIEAELGKEFDLSPYPGYSRALCAIDS